MTRAISLALAIVALSVLGPGPVPAASFDCTKAGTAVEKMICGDPTLSRLDEELSEAYRQTLSADPEPEMLKAQQKAWLRDRRDNCTVVACLREMYKNRIHRLRELATFAAATGMSETVLGEFLRAELKLESEYSRPKLVPVRSPAETVPGMIAFVVNDWDHGGVKRGIIDVSQAQPRVLRVEDYECNCQGIGDVSAVRLVASERDFVLANHGGGGTCTGVEHMDIFRIGDGGSFERVWQRETYGAGRGDDGVHAAGVAEISFPRMRDGPDRAILRSVKEFRCGDEDCFCRDGPLIRDFVELFVWDPATRRFRLAR